MVNKGIDKIIGTYQSVDHSTSITYFQYVPHCVTDGKAPAAIVQVIHGMCEYIERYEHFASFLAEHNIIMCGADHLGHGRSAASVYDLGYFAEKDGDQMLAADAYHLTQKMQSLYPDIPYFYFGHSMGSFILRDLLSRFPPNVSGAIICGTSGGGQPFGVAKTIIKAKRAISGSRYRSHMLNQLMFGTYCNKIENPKTQHDWISRDEQVVAKYEADPKCNFMFTIAAIEDLVTLLARVSNKEWASKLDKNLPLFLIAGEQDPVGDYGKGVTKVYERIKAAEVKDVSIQLYPEDRHEVLNEPDKDIVMNDVLNWMQEHGLSEN